jgi:hypothetical protein
MASNDQMLRDHSATYASFVKISFGASIVIAIALALMGLFLL